jgi:hypothetical protein
MFTYIIGYAHPQLYTLDTISSQNAIKCRYPSYMACQNVSLMGEGIMHPLFVAVDEVHNFLPGAHISLQCPLPMGGL